MEKDLGQSPTFDVTQVPSEVVFCVDRLDLSDIPRRVLNNVAELRLVFTDSENVVHGTVSMVVAVDDREGVLHRTVFSPLE